MRCWFQFITVPSVDTPGTVLLLHFDDKRYLFGQLAEGTQRALLESNIRSLRVSHIFLTGTMSWANHGGLLGVLLNSTETLRASTTAVREMRHVKLERARTMLRHFEAIHTKGAERKSQEIVGLIRYLESKRDNGASVLESLHIFGPKNLTHTMAAFRKFVLEKNRPLRLHEWGNRRRATRKKDSPIEPSWVDCHVKVWNLNISPSTENEDSLSENSDTNDISTSDDTFHGESETEDARYIRQAVISDIFKTAPRRNAFQEMPLSAAPSSAPLFIRNQENNTIQRFTKPTDSATDIDVLIPKVWPGTRLRSLPATKPSNTSVSYIIQQHDARGKFDVNKALSLGIEPGPKFGRLTKRESVEAKDGSIVTPEMVLGTSSTGQALAIIDLPTTAYIGNFLKRPEWSRNPELIESLQSIIWILGPDVAGDERLRDFMSKMPKVKHIVASPDHCPNHAAFTSSAVAAVKFSMIDPERYQAPICDVTPVPFTESTETIQPAQARLIFKTQPAFSMDTSMVGLPFNPAGFSTEKKFYRPLKSHNHHKGLGDDIEVVTLGTGSSAPSKSRNVSATLLRVPNAGNYLLDCGENTLGQLRRMFQPDEVAAILRDLRMIWISHLHADHHLGTISVIRAWRDDIYGSNRVAQEPIHDLEQMLRERRLCVIACEPIHDFLREYASVEDYGYANIIPIVPKDPGYKHSTFHFHRFDGDTARQDTVPGGSPHSIVSAFSLESRQEGHAPLTSLLQEALGVADISTCFVQHCNDSRGIALTFKDGFKLCYSGDCRPSDSLAKLGLDSDLLIHEATFENDMLADALAKKHSTVPEALSLARRMRAKKVILTHFSQRYYSVPVIPQWASGRVPVIVAFDMMRLRLGDAMTAQRYLPLLVKRFVPEQLENGGQK